MKKFLIISFVGIVPLFFLPAASILIFLGALLYYSAKSDSPSYTSLIYTGVSFNSNRNVGTREPRLKGYHDYQVENKIQALLNEKTHQWEATGLSSEEEFRLEEISKHLENVDISDINKKEF